MAPTKTSLLAVLRIVQRERLIELNPRDLLRAEEALASRDDWTVESLAVVLASLLATDQDSWRDIHGRLAELLGSVPGQAQRTTVEDAEQPEAREDVAPAADRSIQRRRIPRVRGWVWAALIAAVALAVFSPLLVRSPDPPPTMPASSPTPYVTIRNTTPPPPKVQTETIEDGQDIGGTNDRVPVPAVGGTDAWLLLALLGLATLLVAVLGLCWLLLPRGEHDALAALRTRLRDRADQRRAALLRDARGRGVPYHIPRSPPFARTAMEDAATLLDRGASSEPSAHLDIDATIDRTSRSAGRIEPVYQSTRQPDTLLVLVDIEKSEHPYLDGVTWVLDYWLKLGVRLERYNYRYVPTVLRPATGGPAVRLGRLNRQKSGLPLLILSRLVDPSDTSDDTSRLGRARWLAKLTPWPARVLIDLDPRPDSERPYYVREVFAECTTHGLRRYPFSGRGVVAAARALTTGYAPTEDPPHLPALDAIEPALKQWATCAAYVPNPVWPQLEAIRQHFPEISRALPEPCHVQRLIDWVSQYHGASDEIEGPRGQRLVIPRNIQTELIAAQRKAEQGMPRQQTLEWRARSLLIEQLRAATPGSKLERLWRELKIAFHEAVLDPERADELLARFAGTEVDEELETMLRQEMALQVEHKAVLVKWSGAVREAVQGRLASQGRVRARRLAWPWWRVQRGAVGLAAAVSAVMFANWLLALQPETLMRERSGDYVPDSLKVQDERDRGVSKPKPEDTEPEADAPEPTQPELARADQPKRQSGAASRTSAQSQTTSPAAAESDAGVAISFDPEVKITAPEPLPTLEIDQCNEPGTGKPLGIRHVALKDDAPMRFVRLATGEFMMGSPETEEGHWKDERPCYRVKLSSFEIGETEVTQKQWYVVMGTKPSICKYGCGDDLPVQNVSWLDVVEFMNKLSIREYLTACYVISGDNVRWKTRCWGYRLPTEAEWEYAARAGTTTRFSFGDDDAKLGLYAQYDRNAKNRVHRVKSKRGNSWSFYDMHGNVSEWVWDWYGSYASGTQTNPSGPLFGTGIRVLRGGGFVDRARNLRSAERNGNWPSHSNRYSGFRCARSWPPFKSPDPG